MRPTPGDVFEHAPPVMSKHNLFMYPIRRAHGMGDRTCEPLLPDDLYVRPICWPPRL